MSRSVWWRQISFLALLLGGAGLLQASDLRAQDEVIGLPLGSQPEAVQVEDLDGNPVDLADFIGSVPVLIEFWATWCSLCAALEPQMQAAYANYADEVEFLVMAVAVNQSQRRVRRHAEEHPMPGRVLWDAGGAAVRAFKAPSTSYVVGLDAAGRVAYTGVGGDQNLEAAVERVVSQ